MIIKEALKQYHKIEIELLLAHVLRKNKEFVFMNGEKSLSADQLISLSALAKRREKGEPIAYILGYKDFMGMKFKVNKNVLIPRPETEMVVDLVLAKLRSSPPKIGGVAAVRQTGRYDTLDSTISPPCGWYSSYSRRRGYRFRQGFVGQAAVRPIKILDVGTGSGCIIISIAKLWKTKSVKGDPCHCQFFASDITSEALKVSRENAKAHKVKIKFIKSDLLKNVKGNFDIIIANLPYVPDSDINKVVKDLKFEPKSAIFQKENGLYLIRRLLDQISAMKSKPKLVYLEFDPRQKRRLSILIKKSLPESKTKFYKDYNNFWRYAEISFR